MVFYNATSDEALRHFKVKADRGLTNSAAAKIRASVGANVLTVRTEPWWKKLLEPFADVFMLILLAALGITIFQGEHLEAILIAVIIGVNAAIFYVQYFSTSRIIRALKRQTVQTVNALRDGRRVQLPVADLVPGDIIFLGEGEKIPADCRILQEATVQVDESILTGESEHVHKHSRKLSQSLEVYDQSNMLFSGAFIVSGSVTALVVRTGSATEFGRIADLAAANAKHTNPVQRKINSLIKYVAIAVGILAALVLALELYRDIEFTAALKFVLAMTVSAVPEGLPVAISIILALGMRRMAKKKALITNIRAIETIGAINTICTDKTGTLTENKLAVQAVWSPKNKHNLLTFTMKCAILEGDSLSDPLDGAFKSYIGDTSQSVNGYDHAVTFPFEQKIAMSGNLWYDGHNYLLVVKGAPESILARCDLAAKQEAEIAAELDRLTGRGYRVVALAVVKLDSKINSFARLQDGDWQFAGLVAVADQLRADAKTSLAVARRAGVSVRMITGDHFNTAYAISKQLGLVQNRDEVMDCRELESLDDDELAARVQHVYAFSRVTPEQKYRLLQIFERNNITAMTGDGVNDVPALTKADIGIAMGSGPGIARDAGDIILLDDNFKNINEAMREGRTIVENIRRMLVYLLATNAGEVLTIVAALVIGVPLPLLPIQILWVNIVTDSCLTVPLGLEKPESNVMTRAPKPFNAPLLSKVMVARMILMAVIMAALATGIYLWFAPTLGYPAAGTLAFLALVVAQITNALNLRSNFESLFTRLRVFSLPILIGLALSIGLQFVAFFTPLAGILHIQTVPFTAALWTVGLALVLPTLVLELHKLFFSRR